MAALSGGAIGAGIGGLTGALVGLGIPEYEAKRYEGKVKEGSILISVHSENSDELSRAKAAFKELGAHDISATVEAHADTKAQDVSDTGDPTLRKVARKDAIRESDVPLSSVSRDREPDL
jgi:uncharacterized membrane protein